MFSPCRLPVSVSSWRCMVLATLHWDSGRLHSMPTWKSNPGTSLVFFPEVNSTSRLANPQYHISWDHLPHHILTKRTISLRKWKRMPVQLNYGSTIRRPKDSECWWKVTQDILRHRIRSNAQCFRGHRHKLSARHSVRMCPENKLAEDLHIKTGNRLIAAIMDIYYHIWTLYGHLATFSNI
jgi:hypothetical protein